MSNEQRKSFLDPKTMMAVAFVGLSWVGWQYYMQTKYPNLYETKQKVEKQANVETQSAGAHTVPQAEKITQIETENRIENKTLNSNKTHFQKETLTNVNTDFLSFDISSQGMGLKNIVLNKYKDREGKFKTIGAHQGILPFETRFNDSSLPIHFVITQEAPLKFVGVAQVNGMQLYKTMELNPEEYTIKTKTTVKGENIAFNGLTIYLADLKKPFKETSFLDMSSRFLTQDFYVDYDGTNERILAQNEEEASKEVSFKQVNFSALSTDYFTMALVNKSDIFPKVSILETTKKNPVVKSSVYYPVINKGNLFSVDYLTYVGPKSYNILKHVSAGLENTVDYGMFSFIGKYLLKLLHFFHSIFSNWGIAIILMTIIVRLLVLPFALTSFKSMKKMQDIQPQLKQVRVDFKDNPQQMNQEIMKIMKESKANPISGCLPMLLQFPVFIVLYQVLGQSIELYQAPFYLWIQDLSLKDPYYILPILVGVSFFLQQKLTPSTMDETQRKIMMFMPIMFCAFMIALPSGLSLYILVSTLFGVMQQFIFLSDKKQAQSA